MEIKDVENLAELARLELSDDEKKAMLKDLDGVLAYVKTIETSDASDVDVKPELYNAWREDTAKDIAFSKESIIKQFPDSQDGFLKVKKIL